MDDGYIKFTQNRIIEEINNHRIIDDINIVRSELLRMNLIGSYGEISFGNISCRVHSNEFIITGSNTGNYNVLELELFALVYDCDIEANSISSKGIIPASSESMSHYAVYAAEPNINAVIHIHSKQLWERYLNILPATDESAEYGTPEIALSIQKVIKTYSPNLSVIILSGHYEGLLSIGKDLYSAYNNIKELY